MKEEKGILFETPLRTIAWKTTERDFTSLRNLQQWVHHGVWVLRSWDNVEKYLYFLTLYHSECCCASTKHVFSTVYITATAVNCGELQPYLITRARPDGMSTYLCICLEPWGSAKRIDQVGKYPEIRLKLVWNVTWFPW